MVLDSLHSYSIGYEPQIDLSMILVDIQASAVFGDVQYSYDKPAEQIQRFMGTEVRL